MSLIKEPPHVAAPFELLIASRPSLDRRSHVRAMAIAVAAHALMLAAAGYAARPAVQLAPRGGVDTIMLELPDIVVPPRTASAAERAEASTRARHAQTATLEHRIADAPQLAPLVWEAPAAAVPITSDAIFASAYDTIRMNGAGTDGYGAYSDPDIDELANGPTYTPFTRGTELENREEVEHYLLVRYPPDLRELRLGGRAVLWILIDEYGHARKAMLLKSSGRGSLDDAALAATDIMVFAPAWNAGRKVPVWVQLPVTFRVVG